MTPPSPPRRSSQVGLLRAVVRRARSDWPLVLAAWLLLACSTSLITAAATYSESVDIGGFRRMIEASPPATSAVRVYVAVQANAVADADGTVAPIVAAVLRPFAGHVSRVTTTDTLSLAGVDPSDETRQILVGAYAELDAHATLAAGTWARPGASPPQATLSVGAAAALKVSLGDRVGLTSKIDPSRRVEIAIVGLWRPKPDDRYWLGSALELTGAQTSGTATTRGPFAVDAADLPTLAGDAAVNLEWRWLPAIDSLQPGQGDGLRAAIATLGDRAGVAYPGAYVRSGLPDTLKSASTALLVARSSILLLFAQFAVLAGYVILLVAGMLVERRRPESALLGSRGASGGQLAWMAFAEAALLAVPAVALAPFVAQLVVRLLGAAGPLAGADVLAPVGIDATTVAAAIGAGIGCVAVLTLPALPGSGPLSGVRATLGRQVGRTLAQRLGLDLALVVVAAIAIWQLQLYGAPLTRTVRGDLGIDPLLVAAPAIGLLAGALIATRVVPRLGEIGERLFERGAGLAAALLARQIGRRPLRYTRLALLLMLAASLATFAATFGATWSRSQSDQAAYQAAADERLTVVDRPTLPDWALGPAAAAIPGVTAVLPVARGPLEIGRDVTDGQLLAIDAAATAKAELASVPRGALAPDMLAPGALDPATPDGSAGAPMKPIPGRPSRLALVLDTKLLTDGAAPDPAGPATPTSLSVAVVVADGTGLHRIAGGTAPLTATSARVEIDLSATAGGTAYRPAYPLRLEAVEFGFGGSQPAFVTGTVELKDVEEFDASNGPAWQSIGFTPGAAGWAWSRVETQTVTAFEAPAGRPGLVSIGDAAGQTPPVLADPFHGQGVSFRYWAVPASSGPIPALADPRLLEATGARVGDTLVASRSGFETPVRVAGTANSFPTMDPARPFLVVDRAALQLFDYATWGRVEATQEWWLTVEPGRDAEVAAALAGAPYSAASVVSRAQLESAMLGDPVALGVIGALTLGAVAAIVLAAIGFLVTAAFLARERLGELALLRALGESTRGVVGMLALEEAFLLAYGLVAGTLLGLLLGWLAIPFAALTSSGAAAVPVPAVVVPWPTILLVGLPVVAGLAVGAVILVRVAAGGQIAPALRGREVEP